MDVEALDLELALEQNLVLDLELDLDYVKPITLKFTINPPNSNSTCYKNYSN